MEQSDIKVGLRFKKGKKGRSIYTVTRADPIYIYYLSNTSGNAKFYWNSKFISEIDVGYITILKPKLRRI